MKRFIIFFLLVLLGLFLNNIVYAQSTKEAYKALKKLESRTQTGISYRDYGPALGDAKMEVNLFLESPDSKNNPQLKKIFSKVMANFEDAGSIWRCKFVNSPPAYQMVPDNLGGTDSIIINQILRGYPKARYALAPNGCLPYEKVLSIIWQEASEELKKAGPLLK